VKNSLHTGQLLAFRADLWREFTFKVVHVYTVPAKNMPAVGHLWCFEIILQADSTFKLVSGMIYHLFDSFPFMLADALKAVE